MRKKDIQRLQKLKQLKLKVRKRLQKSQRKKKRRSTLHRPASKIGVKVEKEKKPTKDAWVDRSIKKDPQRLGKMQVMALS